MNIRWTDRAEKDRNSQETFIAADNPRAAVEQIDSVMARVASLADHPEQGRPGRRRGTRELVVPGTPFVVVYRLQARPERVEILRVLHGKQKYDPLP